MSFDVSTIILPSINFTQVVLILFLLSPVLDIVTIAKNIKLLEDNFKSNIFTISLAVLYVTTIISAGIIAPTKTLSQLKSKAIKQEESADTELKNVIAATNAVRDNILGAFSLFFLLITLRLCDFLKFSAKLVEFANLMANYDLIDIAYVESKIDLSISNIDSEDEQDSIHWPSIADFSKSEHCKIQKFFKFTPKKALYTESDIRRETRIINVISDDTNTTNTPEISKETFILEKPKLD
ncbi:unnamed protein product [Colias eurytheme]|nr:unnamed protein product [Colias eurytheme]